MFSLVWELDSKLDWNVIEEIYSSAISNEEVDVLQKFL